MVKQQEHSSSSSSSYVLAFSYRMTGNRSSNTVRRPTLGSDLNQHPEFATPILCGLTGFNGINVADRILTSSSIQTHTK